MRGWGGQGSRAPQSPCGPLSAACMLYNVNHPHGKYTVARKKDSGAGRLLDAHWGAFAWPA